MQLFLFVFILLPALHAAELTKPERAPREIYVPFGDLNVLLEQQPKRVLLSREEYDDLAKKAKKTPVENLPLSALIVSADYRANLSRQRAEIAGTLAIDVLEDGLFELPLGLGGVGLRSATLDGKGAALGQGDNNTLKLFVEGKGRHELKLEMVAPLVTTAAKQRLQYRLPRPAAAKLQLTVTGDVEIKSGAAVISRTVDTTGQEKQTRFELLPQQGDVALEMSLNSHLQRQSRAFVMQSVLVDEITEGYEKLHAAVSLEILYQPMDGFRFAVPEGFEITEIASPLLARWDVQEAAGKKVVNVKLREQTNETVVLNLTALRTPSRLSAWKSPELQPLPLDDGPAEVISQEAVVGLMVEDRLKPESLEADGLIAIDAAVLDKAMPASLVHPAPGTPPLKPVAAYYAPESKYRLSAKFIKPPVEMAVSTSLLWRVSDRGYEVLGGFTLLPRGEKLFSFDFTIPAGWTITGVTAAEEKPLKFDCFGAAEQPGRVRVYVPQGMAADQEFKVNFQAARTPKGWLADWKTEKDSFPSFAVSGAIRDEGAIAVEARDDIAVRPETLKALIPLDDEKAGYGLEGVAVNLAYRYENPQYAAAVVFERTSPRSSARTFSFLQISPEGLNAHYEVIYNIEEARTQNLSLLLPENTPAALSIRGLDSVVVKEYTATPSRNMEEGQGGKAESLKDSSPTKQRRWNILLAEAKRGKVRLAVDFQQLLPSQELKDYVLPIIAADGVLHQSGLVAVEGCAEFDVQVKTTDRKVDVGELVDADYQPGRRLLGVYGFAGNPPEVKIDVARNPSYPLYPALVQKAALTTQLSPDRESHTEAQFELRTKALYLELQLPADSELWSAEIDATPIKPQREGKSVLVGLPAASGVKPHTLKFVYRTTTASLGLSGKFELAGPKVFLRADRGVNAVEVPLADLQWKLRLPNGYEVVRSTGTVTTDELARPEPAAKTLYAMCGGVGKYGLLPAMTEMATVSSRASMNKTADYVNEGYTGSRAYSEAAKPAPTYTPAAESPKSEAKPDEAPLEPQPAQTAAGSTLDDADQPEMQGGMGGMGGMKPPTERKPARTNKYSSMDLSRSATKIEYPEANDYNSDINLITSKMKPEGEKTVRDRLTGVRSLKIDLAGATESDGRTMTFRSLGDSPLLRVDLADRERFGMLGWGVALAAFLFGAAISRRSAWTKTKYVLALAIIATLVPMLWDYIAAAWVCNLLFFAACWLIPYYLLAGLARCICSHVCGAVGGNLAKKSPAMATVLLVALSLSAWNVTNAQDAPKPPGLPYVIQVVEPGPPITVPDDAIVVPYDAALPPTLADKNREAEKKAEKLLLPYDKYVDLWNRAYPDKKIETKKPPADYALSGASYKTTLEGEEFLLVTGVLELDVYSKEFVQIPLALNGGVIAQALLDGKPARLSMKEVAQQPVQSPQQPSQQAITPAPGIIDPRFFVLTLEGRGHHKLEINLRLKIAREGGWRAVDGLLPSAPAAACAITVPLAPTELRLARVSDRQSYDIDKPGETISTALGQGGSLAVRWRAKADEAKVDLALTARSDAVLDVQEDGLRWTWQLNLDFRGKMLEEFAVEVPAMYTVEKVEGGNVRGWQADKTAAGQSVKVTLLKAAKDREQITLVFSKAAAIGKEKEKEFSAELLQLKQAALHTGRILLRRSPLLDVRTLDRAGMTRTDIPQDLPKLVGAENTASPLNVQPFEAYRFDRNPAEAIRLTANPIEAKMAAKVQSILKITDANRTLESRITFQIKDRAAYRLQAYLPDDFRLDHLSLPGDFEYSITAQNGRQLLTVFLTAGRQGDVGVRLLGTLGKQSGMDKVPLPRLEVLGVERQEGDIAVQASDAYEASAFDLKNCEKVLLDRFYGWLKPEQRPLTHLALQYRQGDYAGALKFAPKQPEVDCTTISNVRVTNRAIEETILLDYSINNAGVRKFSFILPWWMKDAKISVPMLREKSNIPLLEKAEKSPRLVTIELQDEATGQHRVLVENDRQLDAGPQDIPIPTVNGIRTCRRYVTLESYGRDEILVDADKLAGMEKLIQGQKEWDRLKEVFGRAVTYAYLVAPDAAAPKLVYKSNVRSAVQTAGARIGMSVTNLAVDENGAYRAEQTISIFNSTEQFLEVDLPGDAELWTAKVAGEPVKPVKDTSGKPKRVKIPLVKTAAGDLEYPIVLCYGGKMPAAGTILAVSFPLTRCANVTPELSQVYLYLPRDRKWFDFGGTMRLVEEEHLRRERIAQDTKQLSGLVQTMQESSEKSSKFDQIRAANNLKQMALAVQNFHDARRSDVQSDVALEKEKAAFESAVQTARQEAEKVENAPQQAAAQDNRGKLREYFNNQTNSYSGKSLAKSGNNFGETAEGRTEGVQPQGQQFNPVWFDQKKLLNAPASKEAVDKITLEKLDVEKKFPQQVKGKQGGKAAATEKPTAAKVAQGANKRQLEESNAQQQIANGNAELTQAGDAEEGQVLRYQQRLQQQSSQPMNLNNNANGVLTLNASGTMPNMPPGYGPQPNPSVAAVPGMVPANQVNRIAGPGEMNQPPAPPPQTQPVQPPTEEAMLEVLNNPTRQAGVTVLPAAAGMASLEVKLPIDDAARWSVYGFTTPRGEAEITARSISGDLMDRLLYAVCVIAALVLLGWIIRHIALRGSAGILSAFATTLMIVLGIVAVIFGVLPMLGLLAIMAGIAMKIANAAKTRIAVK